MLQRVFLVLVILACFLGQASSVQAQEHGIIQALATVVSSLSVTGIYNLNFGTVTPGINKSVDKSTAGEAGEWLVQGQPAAEVSVDFTLPSELYLPDSSATLLIMFNATDASYDDGTGGGQLAPAGVLNPNGPSTMNIGAGGLISVWIGGAVLPLVSQTHGDYAADVILTVAYTGS